MVKSCNGPCNQGREPCPTPDACELDERVLDERIKERWKDFALAVGVVVVCFLVLLVLPRSQ